MHDNVLTNMTCYPYYAHIYIYIYICSAISVTYHGFQSRFYQSLKDSAIPAHDLDLDNMINLIKLAAWIWMNMNVYKISGYANNDLVGCNCNLFSEHVNVINIINVMVSQVKVMT